MLELQKLIPYLFIPNLFVQLVWGLVECVKSAYTSQRYILRPPYGATRTSQRVKIVVPYLGQCNPQCQCAKPHRCLIGLIKNARDLELGLPRRTHAGTCLKPPKFITSLDLPLESGITITSDTTLCDEIAYPFKLCSGSRAE